MFIDDLPMKASSMFYSRGCKRHCQRLFSHGLPAGGERPGLVLTRYWARRRGIYSNIVGFFGGLENPGTPMEKSMEHPMEKIMGFLLIFRHNMGDEPRKHLDISWLVVWCMNFMTFHLFSECHHPYHPN
jgi:hypothetical protein